MEPTEPELTRIGDAIRSALDVESNAADEIRVGRAKLMDHIARQNAARRDDAWRLRGWLVRPGRLALFGGACIGAVALWMWARVPISFHASLSAAPIRVGDVVEATGAQPLVLSFSEGSSVALAAGGRARVLSAERAGARVLLEGGSADITVVHRAWRATRWSFEAGPFKVVVTGTRFHLDWHPNEDQLSVQTSEGSALVSGGCLQAPRTVQAGSSLQLSCAQPTAQVRTATAPPPPPSPELDAAPMPDTAPSNKQALDDGRWRKLVAGGRLLEGLRAAEGADFGHVCRTATQKELLALADAARLFGHTGRAVEALKALRQRFPRTPDAATAAFALGRIAFERRGAYGDAIRWFATYLDEQPNGPLMGDAVGRLMEARQHAGDRRGAQADARSYLRRFPDGPYGAEARALLAE